MRTWLGGFVGLVVAAACCGCAHHKQNQYAYAPPLAPPVYPQPQAATPAMAAMTAAPPMAGAPMVVAAAPAGTVLPPGAVVAAPAAGMPVTVDPCCMPGEGGAMPVVYEAAGQTPQCPPGP